MGNCCCCGEDKDAQVSNNIRSSDTERYHRPMERTGRILLSTSRIVLYSTKLVAAGARLQPLQEGLKYESHLIVTASRGSAGSSCPQKKKINFRKPQDQISVIMACFRNILWFLPN